MQLCKSSGRDISADRSENDARLQRQCACCKSADCRRISVLTVLSTPSIDNRSWAEPFRWFRPMAHIAVATPHLVG